MGYTHKQFKAADGTQFAIVGGRPFSKVHPGCYAACCRVNVGKALHNAALIAAPISKLSHAGPHRSTYMSLNPQHTGCWGMGVCRKACLLVGWPRFCYTASILGQASYHSAQAALCGDREGTGGLTAKTSTCASIRQAPSSAALRST